MLGTTEGRLLAEFLERDRKYLLMYVWQQNMRGQLLEENSYLQVSHSRLDQTQMRQLILEESIHLTVDATHPYAVEVSANIRKACEEAGCEYIRLLRSSVQTGEEEERWSAWSPWKRQ
ncbi:MAG: precorrin-6A/cobalt-precorrin-6A reductase [Lachnospiraceae bacterium]